MLSQMVDVSQRRNGACSVEIVTDATARVTHLVVGPGAKRTLKVIFALLYQAHVVQPDFFSHALDGVWPSENEFSISGRNWGILEGRAEVLRNHAVFIDPRLRDPPRPVLSQVIELSGGRITRDQAGATAVLAATSTPPSGGVEGGRGRDRGSAAAAQAPIHWSISDLFDIIEAGKEL
jgi:hypothetical protein